MVTFKIVLYCCIFQLKFDRNQYFLNVMNLDKHDSMRDIIKLRKPIDKDK